MLPKTKKKKFTCFTDEVARPVRMGKDKASFFHKNDEKRKSPKEKKIDNVIQLSN